MIFHGLDKYINEREVSSDGSLLREDFGDEEKWAREKGNHAIAISPSPYTMVEYYKVENINLWSVCFTNGDHALMYMEKPEFDKLLIYLEKRP